MTSEPQDRRAAQDPDADETSGSGPGRNGHPSDPIDAPQAAEPDWKDQCLRLAADFENYKKRTRSEMSEVRHRERDRVLLDWLEVADSAERALAGCRDSEGPWVEGLQGIVRQTRHLLERYEVVAMESDEATFDPHQHEAIGAVPVPGVADGTVLQTERTGYRFRDGRVLRPARVVVARNG